MKNVIVASLLKNISYLPEANKIPNISLGIKLMFNAIENSIVDESINPVEVTSIVRYINSNFYNTLKNYNTSKKIKFIDYKKMYASLGEILEEENVEEYLTVLVSSDEIKDLVSEMNTLDIEYKQNKASGKVPVYNERKPYKKEALTSDQIWEKAKKYKESNKKSESVNVTELLVDELSKHFNNK
jgi:hypothetical protein